MGNTLPKIFLSCFLNMKISLQPVNQFDWNLANLLADSFLTNRVRIFISLFVYSKLEYFFTGSASDSLSLSLTAYNKRKSALDKNLRHGVLVKRLSVKIVTLWQKKNDSLELVCMYCRTNSVKNSYFICIVNEWNSLPNDFKESVSIFGIKHKVKSFLGNSHILWADFVCVGNAMASANQHDTVSLQFTTTVSHTPTRSALVFFRFLFVRYEFRMF